MGSRYHLTLDVGVLGSHCKKGKSIRCGHRWSIKQCHECEHENDIAARFCEKCKAELVDPNEKLKLDFHRMKANKQIASTDEVRSFNLSKFSGRGNILMLKVNYKTDYANFDMWYNPESADSRIRGAYEKFSKAFFKGKVAPNAKEFCKYETKGDIPRTITYMRPKGSKFYEILDYNKPIDVEPELG